MTQTLTSTLAAGLEFLREAAREGVRPPEAKQRLRALREKNAGLELDLVWEEEAYDQSVHYDLLLQLNREGTVSLSFSPDRAVPWPLRGVRRWTDSHLLRVNNSTLKFDQAMACLDCLWQEAPILDRLVNVCLIQDELQRRPIELSDAELQQAMDAFRRAHRLCKAEDTFRWMERRGMTHDQLERLVADEATVAKLRVTITEGRIEDYFDRHQTNFDIISMARIEFIDEASAHHTLAQVQTGRIDFLAAAQGQFLDNTARGREASQPLFMAAPRGTLPDEWKASALQASPGGIIGPLREGHRFVLLRILSVTPARLDETTHLAIQKILFQEWLEERRRNATIEWFWGNVAQTASSPETGSGKSSTIP